MDKCSPCILKGSDKMKLNKKQMIKIFKDKSWGLLDEDEMKQFNIFMFGEEFMESANKGSKVIYSQENRKR